MKLDDLKWTEKACVGKNGDDDNVPSARCGHTLSIVGSNVFLFGGLDDRDFASSSPYNAAPNNDLFVLRLRTTADHHEWTRLRPANGDDETMSSPAARWRHSATRSSSTETLVFGGFTSSSMTGRLNDFWVFNAVTVKWRRVEVVAAESNDDLPCPRGSHTANTVGRHVYIFGGHGGGGEGEAGEYERSDMNDLYQLDLNDWTCRKVVPKGAPPEQRSGHRSCVVGTSLYVFGGRNSRTFFDDVHVLSTKTTTSARTELEWTRIEATTTIPCASSRCWWTPRSDFVACPFLERYVVVFGGTGERASATHGASSRDGDDGSLLVGNDDDEDAIVEVSLNDVFVFDITDSTFAKVSSGGGDVSTNDLREGRSEAAGVCFEKESSVLVYGGWTNKFCSELFSVDLTSLVPTRTVTND